MKAPNFSLPDQNGKIHRLSDYEGTWRVVYIYPKDNTPTCTNEACNFRDSHEELTKLNIVVFGISADSVSSHRRFASKYDLNFLLLSDESMETIKAYGAWGGKVLFGRSFLGIVRKTFLINPQGEIVKTYEGMNVTKHAQEILSDVQSIMTT